MDLCKRARIIILKMASTFLLLPTTKNEAIVAKVVADTALMVSKKLPNNNTFQVLKTWKVLIFKYL
jgi:hypothetical protein